jgi:predicted DNA-binding protein YlxM (UPF0122 family)
MGRKPKVARFKGMTTDEKRSFLEDYYCRKQLSQTEIAFLVNVTPEAINYWVRKFFPHNHANCA